MASDLGIDQHITLRKEVLTGEIISVAIACEAARAHHDTKFRESMRAAHFHPNKDLKMLQLKTFASLDWQFFGKGFS